MSPAPLRLLVVEDEAIQREALAAMCRLVLDGRPAEVSEAADGAAAVEMAASLRPDIILMDIKMPTLDGIEAARRVAAGRAPPVEIIFVTAYDDFAYAKEALALGAADYLLKPVGLEELRKVLTAAWERVEAARRESERAERTARRLRAAMSVLRLQVFRDLLDGTLTSPSADTAQRERLGLAGVAGQPSLAMLFAPEPPPAGEAAGAALAEQDVAEAFGGILGRRVGSAWLAGPAGPGRLGLVCEPPADRRGESARNWALALADELKAEAERLTGRRVSAGVGKDRSEEGGLAASIREASGALAFSAQAGPGCLFHVTDVRAGTGPGPYAAALPPVGPLLNAIRLGQADQTAEAAARVSGELSFSARGADSPGPARVLAAELVALCGRAALEGGADPGQIRPLQEQVLQWLTAGPKDGPSPGELGETFAGFARDAAALARTAHSERRRGVIKRALACIQAGFTRPLTLEDVARQVHVSPYYLSHLLSRESGRSFTDHLTELRMGRARELLVSTELSVGEIAAEVGLSDGNYLARVFKRETGLTPSEYRRQARRGSPDGAESEPPDKAGRK